MESEDSQELSMEILEGGKEITNLPEKSSKRYKIVYNEFINWITLKQLKSFSEEVLLSYFEEISENYKSSSLWARYSMLRSTLAINHNVNIESYSKLRAFLKRKSENYTAKKANTLSAEQIQQFIQEAPDMIHLATKVALIMGVMGACRKTELYAMKKKDVQELGTALLVTIPNTKTKIVRNFTIINEYYEICKKYIDLRPEYCTISAFFLNYQRGKCTTQRIGVNKFSNMGKQIAEFLNLPNANLYTGHTFRRSSATLMVDSGDMNSLKLHRGWKSTVTESYINHSLNSQIDTEHITNFKDDPITSENIDIKNSDVIKVVNCFTTNENLITSFKEEPIEENYDNSNTTDEPFITKFKEEPTYEENSNIDMKNTHLDESKIAVNSPNSITDDHTTNFDKEPTNKPNIIINMKNTQLGPVPTIRVVNCPNSNIKDEHIITNFEEEPIKNKQNLNVDINNTHLGPVPTISVVNCPNSNITINYYTIPNY